MKITNNHGLPRAYYEKCGKLTGKHPRFDDTKYSATEILKGTKEILLTRRHYDDITVDCADLFFMVSGTVFHELMEGGEGEQEISEARLEATFTLEDGTVVELSGGFDLYNAETKTVTDYKNSKVFSVQRAQAGDDVKWRDQLRIYWLLLNKSGFETERGVIVASMTDFSKMAVLRDASYPKTPIATITYSFTSDDYPEAMERVTGKLEDIHRWLDASDDDIPPCTPEERWERDEKWAVMKEGRKSAVKLFDNQTGAESYIAFDTSKDKLYVVHRPGIPTKCVNYCQCNGFCSFYRQYMEGQAKTGEEAA
jgi:hypothetical protein